MVSFSTIPYATVVRRWQRQTLFLYGLTGFASGAVASAALWLGGAWSSTKRISGAGAVSGHPNTIPVDEFVDTVKTSVAGKLRSWAGWSVNKAGDAVSYTANKAGDAVSYTANKAGDAASYTVGKAGDALTYTANKTSDSATALKRRIFG